MSWRRCLLQFTSCSTNEIRAPRLWLVTIWFLPALGPILYLVLGINRIRRRAISLGTHNNVARPIPKHFGELQTDGVAHLLFPPC